MAPMARVMMKASLRQREPFIDGEWERSLVRMVSSEV